MKNKKLIIIFCVFVAVVLVVILSSTIFTFRSAEVYFVDDGNNLIEPSEDDTGVVDAKNCFSDLFGNNIFLLSKDKITQNFEKANLKVKVKYIEKVFPDKVKIFAQVRVPLYYIESEGNVYVCSYDGFVMEKNPASLPPLVELSGELGGISAPEVGSYVSSCFANIENYNIIQKLFETIYNYEGFDYQSIPALIKNVDFQSGKIVCYIHDGARFEISGPSIDLDKKFSAVYGLYLDKKDSVPNGIYRNNIKDANGNYTASVQ